jgi:hypothetical protein
MHPVRRRKKPTGIPLSKEYKQTPLLESELQSWNLLGIIVSAVYNGEQTAGRAEVGDASQGGS